MQKINHKIIKLWLPVILYAGLIFLISSIPCSYFPSRFYSIDKIFHLIEYLFFGLLLTRAIKNSFVNLNRVKLCIIVVSIAILYGVSDEFHQLFVIGRCASSWDVLVDGIGGLIAGVIYNR